VAGVLDDEVAGVLDDEVAGELDDEVVDDAPDEAVDDEAADEPEELAGVLDDEVADEPPVDGDDEAVEPAGVPDDEESGALAGVPDEQVTELPSAERVHVIWDPVLADWLAAEVLDGLLPPAVGASNSEAELGRARQVVIGVILVGGVQLVAWF
jgi:hypothetical protein